MQSKLHLSGLPIHLERDLVFSLDMEDGTLQNVAGAGQVSRDATFTRSGTATYFDSAGVMQTAAANQARIENGALLLEASATNKCIHSRNMGGWTAGNTPTEAQDQTGIDGVANTAWTIGDDDNGAYEEEHISITVPNDSNPVCASIFVKKQSSLTNVVCLVLALTGGTNKSGNIHLNPYTGDTQENSAGVVTNYGADSFGSWWRVWITVTNNSSGNTTARFTIYPAIGTTMLVQSTAATGTAVFDGAQIELATLYPTSFIATAGAEASRTTEAGYPSFTTPRESVGSELVTNGTMEDDSNWANYSTPSTNARSTTQKYGGTYSRKFVTDAADEGIQGDDYTSITGSLYRYSVWVYSSVTTVKVRIRKGDDSGDLLTTSHTVTASTWTELSAYFVETAGGAHAFLAVLAENGATVYVDDASVREVYTTFAEVLGSELVTNGNFDANITGWTSHVTYPFATFEWNAAGSLHFHTTSGAINYGYSTAFALEAGATYKVQWTCTITSGVGPKVKLSGGITGADATNVSYTTSASGVNTVYVTSTATDASAYFFFYYLATDADSVCDLDSISVKKVTNAAAGGTPQGTVVAIVAIDRPQSALTTTDRTLIAVSDNAADVLYYDSGGFRTNDGTLNLATSPTFTRNTVHKVAVKWGFLTSNVAQRAIGWATTGAFTWSTSVAYDGAFTLGTAMKLISNNAEGTVRVRKIWVFNRVLSTDEIMALR